MLLTLIISVITIISFIGFVIYKPTIKFKKISFESFWIISLLGALLLIIFNRVTLLEITDNLFSSSGINPIKLLVIFLSMSGLSIMLEQLGFFKRIASIVLKKAGSSQLKIFIYLYITVSILTIFTSNDIIILTFTPIIIYFAKHAKINPLPLLITEFIAANTWSLMLIIGNPTNIYLASSFDISFIDYFKVMVMPSIIAGLSALLLLYLVFRKDLSKKIEIGEVVIEEVENSFLVKIVLTHLLLCTLLLTVASYLNIEMYLITLIFLISASLFIIIYQKLVLKEKPIYFINTFKKMPWNLAPFVISMFILVIGLNKYDVTKSLNDLLSGFNPIMSYGLTSFLSSNLINNIPMSVLYTNIISHTSISEALFIKKAVYSSIIGSNIGAYLTPIGALAGIMWLKMLKDEEINLSFKKFIKYGALIAIPTIIIVLLVLSIIL